jgi:hypothetical protein
MQAKQQADNSYLVCRRLRQDVAAFWEFATAAAAALGMPAVAFASLLVGRWPSGAPIMRTPAADDAALAGDTWANSPVQPNFGGHDPIIGQADRYGDGERFIDVPTPGGPRRIVLEDEWVVPTGGVLGA